MHDFNYGDYAPPKMVRHGPDSDRKDNSTLENRVASENKRI